MRAATVAIALLVASACGGPIPPAAAPAAPAAAKPYWPLLGTEAPSADAIARRPVVVRVGNDPDARPQAGLSEADVVFEFLVEGGITRFALVFHSQDAERIGPVRSGRLSDVEFMPMLKGILAHVGAEQQTLDKIREAARSGQFVDVDELQQPNAFERVAGKTAPQNTYTSTRRIREAARDSAKVDVSPLSFESGATGATGTTAAQGEAIDTFGVPYDQHIMKVSYVADGDRFRRAQGGQPTIDDATKSEVKPTNVVVIKTDITETGGVVDQFGNRAFAIRSSGSGPVVVLRDGKRFDGKWTRNGSENYRFADASGAAIQLRPGLTWIHVVPMSFDLGT